LAKKKAANRKQFKSIFYFPVDANIGADATHELDFFTQLATYTQFGKHKICEHRPEISKKITVIPHGNNSKHFHPLEFDAEVLEFRNSFFGFNANKTIIGCINRNHYRKDWATLIFAFKYAKENWDDNLPPPFLYLHTVPNNTANDGWNLPLLLQSCNLVNNKDYKIFSPIEVPQGSCIETQSVDEIFLNKVYNSLDMFVSTATGGGWELTFTEAMSCGIPCIVPNHTSFAEIAANGSRAFLLKELLPISHTQESIVRQQCHYEEAGEKMLQVAQLANQQDAALFELLARGLAYTQTLNWADIGKKFVELFKETY
jgi:glycosyltransferase involved in cell wall biosynthesis